MVALVGLMGVGHGVVGAEEWGTGGDGWERKSGDAFGESLGSRGGWIQRGIWGGGSV